MWTGDEARSKVTAGTLTFPPTKEFRLALLGTRIDVNAGQTLTGITMSTYAHSLGTTPDLVLANLKSANTATAHGALVAIGGNASLNTVGLQGASVALASNLASFDVVSFYFWSGIR